MTQVLSVDLLIDGLSKLFVGPGIIGTQFHDFSLF